jgi:hypothetical protein
MHSVVVHKTKSAGPNPALQWIGGLRRFYRGIANFRHCTSSGLFTGRQPQSLL